MTAPVRGNRPETMHDAPRWCQILVKCSYFVWGTIAVLGLGTLDFNLIDPAIQIGVLAFITIKIARRLARADGDPAIFGFVMAAFAAKMLGGVARDLVTNVYYKGVADANEYHTYGKELVTHYRVFDFSPNVGKLSGTGFMRALTGVVYSFSGTSKFGAFMIFAWFGFIGLLLFWRAFLRAVPVGDGRRYGLLVLFLPSLLYWPSALGKDAWCVMGLGFLSYGVACFMTRRWIWGALSMVAGLAAVVYVRPHVALIVFCGIVLAAVVGKSQKKSPAAPVVRVVVFGALFVMGTVLASSTSSFLGVKSLNSETVDQQLNKAEGRTSKEEVGSTFTPVRVNTPLDLPLATVTVLFRPFPWEAHNGPSLGTAAEGVFLIYLSWRGRRRFLSIPHCMRNYPYVAYAVGYLFVFVFAFSAFSNFGILARQRAQVMPAFLVFLCLPERRRGLATNDEPGTPDTAEGPYPSAPAHEDPYANLRDQQQVDPYGRPPRPDPGATPWNRPG